MKYIHVSSENGSITVQDTLDPEFYGWVYEVPDDYKLVLDLKDLEGLEYVYEGIDKVSDVKLVKKT